MPLPPRRRLPLLASFRPRVTKQLAQWKRKMIAGTAPQRARQNHTWPSWALLRTKTPVNPPDDLQPLPRVPRSAAQFALLLHARLLRGQKIRKKNGHIDRANIKIWHRRPSRIRLCFKFMSNQNATRLCNDPIVSLSCAYIKNLSLASVLSPASPQSCTTKRADVAMTRRLLIPYLR